MVYLRSFFLSLCILITLCAGALFAQVDTASISGFVNDPSGSGVPNVQITVTHTGTGLVRTTTSNHQGAYVFNALPIGTYSIEAESPGFKRSIIRNFGPLTVGQSARTDLTLELGQLAEQIQVEAVAPVIESENANIGTVVDTARIQSLPLNGRSPFLLLRVAPGVNPTASGVLDVSGFSINAVSVNGSQAGSAAFYLDGGALNVLQENEVPVMPNVDMVEEFRINTNGQSAEFGMNGGGAINVVTKSGTNALHGTAYEYLRNDAIDANTWTNNRLSLPKNVLRQNQFGFSVGGPVFIPKMYDGRNRTFFFVNYEGIRIRNTQTQQTRVPTSLERQGDFTQTYILDPATRQPRLAALYDPLSTRPNPSGSGFVRDPLAGNSIPLARIDPVAAKTFALVPNPNSPPTDITGANNMVSMASKPRNIDQYMIRLDQQIGANNRIYGRVLHTKNNSTSVTPTFATGHPLDPTAAVSTSDNKQLVISDTHTFTPTLLNELRFSITREVLESYPSSFGQSVSSMIGLPGGYTEIISPRFGIADMSALGGDTSKLALRYQTVGALTNTVSKVLGRHNLKLGAEMRVSLDNNYQPGAVAGSFNFNRDLSGDPQSPSATGHGAATFLLGAVSSGSTAYGIFKADGFRYYAGFVQDDFKMSNRLTLNLGLRYEFIGSPTERFDRYSNFDPTSINSVTGLPGTVKFAGVDFGRKIYPAPTKNFAPRFGFAYDVTGKGSFIARGGYGIFYYQPSGTHILGPYMGFNSTSSYTAFNAQPAFTLANGVPFIVEPLGPRGGDGTFLGSSASFQETNRRIPYVQQWNFGLQHALPGNSVIEASYAGNHGLHQSSSGYNLNQLDPQYLSLGFALDDQVANPFASLGIFGPTISRQQSLLPFPAYTSVNMQFPGFGNSNYHSLLLRFERRYSNGLSYLVSFTGAKMIGDMATRNSAWLSSGLDSGCGQNALYDRRSCRSIEPLDISRRLVASFVYDLPFGKGQRFLTSGIGSAIFGGWQLNGIYEARTGTPLIIRGANNRAADRPDYLRSAKLSPDERNEYRWFDTSAFAQPAMFTFGNAPKTLPDVRGPGYQSLDAAILKNVPLKEALTLQIRADAFNAFNQTNLNLPNTTFTSGSFGQITSAGDARIMQLSLKLLW
jgi:hypothetical protein